jgi:phosphatidylglycerophosphate synthase/putative flippase GtrA
VLLPVSLASVLTLLAAFAIRNRVKGPYRHDRLKKETGSVFLGRFFMEFGYWCFEPIKALMMRAGVTPNQLTAASLVSSVAGAAAFAAGQFTWGGALVILCAILDALDGLVARERGTASDSGELIDAAVDRYAEIATFAGIAGYYRAYPFGFWLALTSLGGALLVSYARAKGEISGIDARMGSMNRGERAVYVGIAGLFSPALAHWLEPAAERPSFHLMLFALLLVALMANITAVRRFVFIYQELKKREDGDKPQAPELPADSSGEQPALQGWFHRAWVASVVATIVDYGAFTLLVEGAAVYTGTSRALGALLGAITNFTLNKLWTFKTQRTPFWVEAPRYTAISLTSLLLNTGGVVLLTEGLRWNPLLAAALVGVVVSLCWNLPLHRHFVFRDDRKPRTGLSLLGALASGTGAVAILFVAYGAPFADEGVRGFSSGLPDTAQVTQASFLPKLRPEAFYSESYTFLLQGEDGTFAKVQFLISNQGLSGHGKALVRAVIVNKDGTTIEDADAFEAGQWRSLPVGTIEFGAHSLSMGADASHRVHFAGKKLLIDAIVLPETRAVRPGGGRIEFDSAGHAVYDQTLFALRSKFDGTVWSATSGTHRLRGLAFADTSYSTMPAYKTASLLFRVGAFDAGPGGKDSSAIVGVVVPPEGHPLQKMQSFLYTSKAGETEVRASDVKITFEDYAREPGGHFEYDVPRTVIARATGASGEKVTLELTARRLVYRQDVVSDLSAVSRFLVSTVAAPMAYTYENGYKLRIERPGQPVEERSGTAFSEFSYVNKPASLPAF